MRDKRLNPQVGDVFVKHHPDWMVKRTVLWMDAVYLKFLREVRGKKKEETHRISTFVKWARTAGVVDVECTRLVKNLIDELERDALTSPATPPAEAAKVRGEK